jgi:hypothetical protein
MSPTGSAKQRAFSPARAKGLLGEAGPAAVSELQLRPQ